MNSFGSLCVSFVRGIEIFLTISLVLFSTVLNPALWALF